MSVRSRVYLRNIAGQGNLYTVEPADTGCCHGDCLRRGTEVGKNSQVKPSYALEGRRRATLPLATTMPWNAAPAMDELRTHRRCQSVEVPAALLSCREREVLQWLSMGKTGQVIASILSVSESTVRMHIRNILRKLDVSNVAHAIGQAFRARILE
jgi:DNA-binding CsgD family transcriptional regulator